MSRTEMQGQAASSQASRPSPRAVAQVVERPQGPLVEGGVPVAGGKVVARAGQVGLPGSVSASDPRSRPAVSCPLGLGEAPGVGAVQAAEVAEVRFPGGRRRAQLSALESGSMQPRLARR